MNPAARPISQTLPRTLAFGAGVARQCATDLLAPGRRRVFVVTAAGSVARVAEPLLAMLRDGGATVTVFDDVRREPDVAMFRAALAAARDARPDAVIGFGGGSPLDVAKLVAALLGSKQDVADVFGIGKLAGRGTYLACCPTTAGTGSEVSPNAILLDEREHLKKGVISPHLVPDAAYVDPELTLGVPPAVTASTGLDALTHCVEAYANKFAHPTIDTYALQGIRLIARSLRAAYDRGDCLDARTDVALGSLYGGMCLGPVNTGAVHALAYPLGSEFGVAHGVSNAMLLPHVLEFNLPAALARYADVAVAMGAPRGTSDEATARAGLDLIRELSAHCRVPAKLTDVGVPAGAVPGMARAAMTVTRLLERNVREVTVADAEAIYRKAL